METNISSSSLITKSKPLPLPFPLKKADFKAEDGELPRKRFYIHNQDTSADMLPFFLGFSNRTNAVFLEHNIVETKDGERRVSGREPLEVINDEYLKAIGSDEDEEVMIDNGWIKVTGPISRKLLFLGHPDEVEPTGNIIDSVDSKLNSIEITSEICGSGNIVIYSNSRIDFNGKSPYFYGHIWQVSGPVNIGTPGKKDACLKADSFTVEHKSDKEGALISGPSPSLGGWGKLISNVRIGKRGALGHWGDSAVAEAERYPFKIKGELILDAGSTVIGNGSFYPVVDGTAIFKKDCYIDLKNAQASTELLILRAQKIDYSDYCNASEFFKYPNNFLEKLSTHTNGLKEGMKARYTLRRNWQEGVNEIVATVYTSS